MNAVLDAADIASMQVLILPSNSYSPHVMNKTNHMVNQLTMRTKEADDHGTAPKTTHHAEQPSKRAVGNPTTALCSALRMCVGGLLSPFTAQGTVQGCRDVDNFASNYIFKVKLSCTSCCRIMGCVTYYH